MENRTIYNKDVVKRATCPAISENLECEILIVGGGLAGLSLAYHLAHHGQKFVLIEAEKIGDCASGINGGVCSPGWSVDFSSLAKEYGFKDAETFYQLSTEGLRWVHSFEDRDHYSAMDIKSGVVKLSLLKSEKEALGSFLKSNLTFQKDLQFINKKELTAYVDSPAYQAGLLFKSGFSFNPFNFLMALKSEINLKCSRAIFEKSKMKNYFETNEFCEIRLLNGHSIRAKNLVIATGGYGGRETGFLRTRWLPMRTSIVVTSPLSKNVRKLVNPRFAFSDDRRAGNYFRLISDDRLLWGRGITALKGPTKDLLTSLAIKDIRTFFPSLEEINSKIPLNFDFAWSGKMAYSKSMMPYVGRLTPRTFALTGFGGHGMNTAPAAARVLAESLLGLSDRVSIFKKIPFKWNGSRFGPIAAEALCKLTVGKDTISQLILRLKRT